MADTFLSKYAATATRCEPSITSSFIPTGTNDFDASKPLSPILLIRLFNSSAYCLNEFFSFDPGSEKDPQEKELILSKSCYHTTEFDAFVALDREPQ